MSVFFLVGVQILQIPVSRLLIMVFLFASLVPMFSWMQRTWQGTLNMLPAYKAVLEMAEKFRAAEEPPISGQVNPIELESGVEFRDVSFRYDKEDRNFVLTTIELFIPARRQRSFLGRPVVARARLRTC